MEIETPIINNDLRTHQSFQYIKDICLAIKNIDERFYGSRVGHIYLSDEIKEQVIERVFAYEFYHQLKLVSKKTDRLDSYSQLQIDPEVSKYIQGYTFPDLVIHGNQTDYELQKVIIEIKISDHGTDDILKLLEYMHMLNFDFGVFICANIHYTTLSKEIKRQYNLSRKFKNIIEDFKINRSELLSRLLIITTDRITGTINCVGFDMLIKSIK
nr:hypothetical protein [uncultured Flavobacterium sp.]